MPLGVVTVFIITNKNGNEIKRFETAPCHAYHFGNAYEKGDEIVLDGMYSMQTALMPDRDRVPFGFHGNFIITNNDESKL